MEFREVAGDKSVRRPSFDVADLVDTPADFHADFTYDDVRVTGGDQTGVSGDGVLRKCLVTGVNLTEARLSHLDLRDTRFADVELSNATLDVNTVRAVEFLTCRATGLRLAIGQATDLYFGDCKLDYAGIEITKVKGLTVFEGCSFRDARLFGDLSDTVFVDCDFAGADFAAQRAERCELPGSRLVGARGLLTLRGARLTRDQAISVADVLATEAGLVIV
ncbi:MAG TPA: pentapeptide repeat-containing protein [Pseudonocardiaceae bacterium]|jgi:uncharacterized protein YjbI with pentapeptide repeats|nr:pentapeptide repeat-containing protein [Pseudonocardiaceae bacterium]